VNRRTLSFLLFISAFSLLFTQGIWAAAPEKCQGVSSRPCKLLWDTLSGHGLPPGSGTLSLRSNEGSQRVGSWYLVISGPFFDPTENISVSAVQALWTGTGKKKPHVRKLLVSEEAMDFLSVMWGPLASMQVTETDTPPSRADDALWISSFDELVPQRRCINVDGVSPLTKGQKDTFASTYPLTLPIYLVRKSDSANSAGDKLAILPRVSNRQEELMTVVAMTGVTAITRKTAALIDKKGVDYPARDIAHWFTDADFVHVSNEVSFKPDCPVDAKTMSFCSDDSYLKVLEDIRANVIELTGNHIADKGRRWVTHTLDLYREKGWKWFAGGANLAEAHKPLLIEHGPNRIAFVGCNVVGPKRALAEENKPGGLPCDFDALTTKIGDLRSKGYLPIATLQHRETYEHKPSYRQIRDLRRLADAGAQVVQGSQAHQAKTMEFRGDSFVAYGLGNLFFDQVWKRDIREMMVHRLIFYGGKLLSIDLRTGMNEERGKPRPMTTKERRRFLLKLSRIKP
jgi:poly-gamma-glutamate capsule biosynthesis protein CapA/YwtB (metallophosphatase superfamily)